MKPAQQRDLVLFLQVGFRVSQRKACGAIGIWPSTCRYRSQAQDQSPLRMRIRDLAAARVRYGYRRLHVLLQRAGWRINAKRVFRLYPLEGLSRRLKSRKKRVSTPRVVQPATRPNERWSRDFVTACLADGRRFRALRVVDNVSKVRPTIEAAFAFAGGRVVQVLERLAATHGLPKVISVDNGPEFISRAMDAWAYRRGVRLEFSRPGRPTANPFIASFNGHFRAECLAQHGFQSWEEARATIEAWRVEYNTVRPHRALGQLTPEAFVATLAPPDHGGAEPYGCTRIRVPVNMLIANRSRVVQVGDAWRGRELGLPAIGGAGGAVQSVVCNYGEDHAMNHEEGDADKMLARDGRRQPLVIARQAAQVGCPTE